MRRRRYQSGSLKKRCGKWVGQWWEETQRRNRVLGPISTMTKSDAKAALNQILAALRASQADVDGNMSLSQFVLHTEVETLDGRLQHQSRRQARRWCVGGTSAQDFSSRWPARLSGRQVRGRSFLQHGRSSALGS